MGFYTTSLNILDAIAELGRYTLAFVLESVKYMDDLPSKILVTNETNLRSPFYCLSVCFGRAHWYVTSLGIVSSTVYTMLYPFVHIHKIL